MTKSSSSSYLPKPTLNHLDMLPRLSVTIMVRPRIFPISLLLKLSGSSHRTFSPLEVDASLTVQLIDNPAFLVQGFTGLQPLIQQATQDFGMSYSDYGVKGKGRGEGKGKDKQSSGKKGSSKGWKGSSKGEIIERLEQEGKGNKSSRAKPYQPWTRHTEVQDYSLTSRPSAWYTSKDFETRENDSGWPYQSSSSKGRSQDNTKGWNSEVPKGKGQNRRISETDTNIFPCEECMPLAASTNPVRYVSMNIGNSWRSSPIPLDPFPSFNSRYSLAFLVQLNVRMESIQLLERGNV